MRRRLVLPALFAALSLIPVTTAQEPGLPNAKDSFRFAVIGDTGTGGNAQREIGELLASTRKTSSFNAVMMMGDNLYGRESPGDYKKKFELPYAPLLKDGVKFYASLGNHDNTNQRFYRDFNMGGQRYYSFTPQENVQFFALDSNRLDNEQLQWVEQELASSRADWKIVFFHHPLYSSGKKHGSALNLRSELEPLFLKHNVSLVLSGHEHFYERIKPQHGIPYFIVGSSAKLRKGDIDKKSSLTALGFDTDNVFMLCEVQDNTQRFHVISKSGATIDSGTVDRPAGQKASAGKEERSSSLK